MTYFLHFFLTIPGILITGRACQKKVVQVIQVEQVVFWPRPKYYFLPRSIDFFFLFRKDFMKVDRPSVQFSRALRCKKILGVAKPLEQQHYFLVVPGLKHVSFKIPKIHKMQEDSRRLKCLIYTHSALLFLLR